MQPMLAISSLGKLSISRAANLNVSESVDAFCREIERSSLTALELRGVRLGDDEEEEQVATTLARCNTLECLHFDGASPAFCEQYCEELSNNVETKLVQLYLQD